MALRKRRERVGTVVLTALIVGGIALPATADPPPGANIATVPDGGARPATFGETPMLPMDRPQSVASLTTPLEALSAQIEAATIDSQMLAERINELKIEHERARLDQAWAQHELSIADQRLTEARASAAEAATEAYKSANELPPQLRDGSILHDLDMLQPRPKRFSESTAYELERTVTAEQEAASKVEKASAAEKQAQARLDQTIAEFHQRDAARQLLQQRYLAAQTDDARERERLDNLLASDYSPGKSNNGLVAAAQAQAAVRFALSQVGKPYRFAEEGPDYFDCSGLVQTAYRPALLLPRVSRDMYQATQSRRVSVALSALLPGDLVFYARVNGDPRSIYHVAMYLGDSQVVHATSTGERVKVQRLNFGPGGPVDYATRVVPAVPAPNTPGPTQPTTDPTTQPTTDPTTDPTTQPTTDPTTDPTTQPTTDPTTGPTTQPTTGPTTQPTT